ncbi:hypothetical protein [Bifidobacterium coryneforme]|uniref:hypothetical protein n=1 Tax=Bifidobacterium coryneforme TaxID=1687 RepID=UPI0004E5BDE2|nr:hypothetical protein [Bifidobacterium coryneforme]AII74873.1 hypothetical protein BCOR_0863 [Bifidobacterium coryneforme]
MNEWYSELALEEMKGKHVRVLLDGGSVLEGRLVYDKQSGFVRLDAPQLEVPEDNGTELETPLFSLLFETEDGIWYPLKGIQSIELAWDEREWEQLCPDDADVAERVVIRGRMWRVVGPDEGSGRVWVCDNSTTFSVDSGMVPPTCGPGRPHPSIPVSTGTRTARTG